MAMAVVVTAAVGARVTAAAVAGLPVVKVAAASGAMLVTVAAALEVETVKEAVAMAVAMVAVRTVAGRTQSS